MGVLDSLIGGGELPPAIAVFVEPGESGPGLPVYGGCDNRSVEYDALGERCARFLLEARLPEATAGYRISADPAQRALVGMSSGGMCAFNAAWERPDAFGKVLGLRPPAGGGRGRPLAAPWRRFAAGSLALAVAFRLASAALPSAADGWSSSSGARWRFRLPSPAAY